MTYIYKVVKTEKTFSHYETKRFLFWTYKKAIYTNKKMVYYSYMKPSKGTKDSSSKMKSLFKKEVAMAHTHAAYDSHYGKGNDIFSDTDKNTARKTNLVSYVATPSGIIRKYDPEAEKDIILYKDMPFNENDPYR